VVKTDFEKMPNPSRPAKEVADRPPFGSISPGLCATSSPRVILSVTMSYFRPNEDMHGF
jgi:hypothetical protein